MFTAFSADTRWSDLAEQKRLHQEQLLPTLRRLRPRVRHAASVQRERALIYRLLAGRFALDSPHHLLLRMLARSAMRRMRRLEALLQELSGTATSGLPRRWLFCLEILVCAAGSSKVDAFTTHASERVTMKSNAADNKRGRK
jgi:hypothetical protein